MKYQLVSRKGCHLCEEAEQLLSDLGIEFEWQDVDADAELKKHFTFRVPVLLKDEATVLEGKFTLERIQRHVEPEKG